MQLSDILNRTGTFFFRWRSFIPVFYLPLIYFGADFESITASGFTWYTVLCLSTTCAGGLLRILIIGFSPRATSGRNLKAMRADSLNTSGAYSIIRNPLYMANFFVILGIVLLAESFLIVVIHVLFFLVFYIPIIYREEYYLREKFKDAYIAYCSKVPCLIPNFRNMKAPENGWCWRMVLRREQDTVLSIIICFVLVQHIVVSITTGQFELQLPLLIFACIVFAAWLPLKFLKKYTRVLKN